MAITFDGQNDRITTSSQGLNLPTNVAGNLNVGGLNVGAGSTVLIANSTGVAIGTSRTLNNAFEVWAGTATTSFSVDRVGRVTTPLQPAFHVPKITNDTIGTTAIKLSFGTATYDVGSNYSDANDRFTAPVAGKYFFYCSINVLNSANAAVIAIRKNGSVYGQVIYAATNYPRMDFNPSAVFDMASGDYVEIFGSINTGTTTIDNAGFFGGYLLG